MSAGLVPKRTLRGAGALVAASLVANVGAAAEPVAIDLGFRGHPGCPSVTELLWKVQERTPDVVLDDAASTVFEISVTRSANASRATLVARRPGTPPAERTVTAATCAEVLDVLAFVISVALDPEAAEVSPPTADLGTASKPSAPAAGPVVVDARPEPGRADEATIEAPPPAVVDSPPDPTRDSPPPSEPIRPLPGWGLGVGVMVEAASGLAPRPTPVGRASLFVSKRTGGVVEPALRASVARGLEQRVRVEPGRGGRLTWTAGRLEGCGAYPVLERALVLEGCSGIDLGALDAEGVGVTPARRKRRLWAAIPLVGRLRWVPATPVAVETQAGAAFALRQDAYVVRAPETLIYDVPAVGGFVGLGLILGLP